jgi:hypothetical protein
MQFKQVSKGFTAITVPAGQQGAQVAEWLSCTGDHQQQNAQWRFSVRNLLRVIECFLEPFQHLKVRSSDQLSATLNLSSDTKVQQACVLSA